VLFEVNEDFREVNVVVRGDPLLHVWSLEHSLSTDSSEPVPLRQLVVVVDIFPSVACLLSEEFGKLDLSGHKGREWSPLVLTKVADSAPACPQDVDLFGLVVQQLHDVEHINPVEAGFNVDLYQCYVVIQVLRLRLVGRSEGGSNDVTLDDLAVDQVFMFIDRHLWPGHLLIYFHLVLADAGKLCLKELVGVLGVRPVGSL